MIMWPWRLPDLKDLILLGRRKWQQFIKAQWDDNAEFLPPIPQMIIKHDLIKVPLVCSRLEMKCGGSGEKPKATTACILKHWTTVIGTSSPGDLTARVENGIGFYLEWTRFPGSNENNLSYASLQDRKQSLHLAAATEHFTIRNAYGCLNFHL